MSLTQEVHRDQCLAILASIGLPLDTPLVMDEQPNATLRRVLDDSIANFHLDQTEIAWTAAAYSAYLPPTARWKNKFDKEYSFDDLVVQLINTPFDGQACAGVHLIMSLSNILRINAELHPILSLNVRDQGLKRVQQLLEIVTRRQSEDGGWEPTWYKSLESVPSQTQTTGPSNPYPRLLATSHLADWLSMLSSDCVVEQEVLDRACYFLSTELDRINQSEPDRFCPISHSIHWLDRMSLSRHLNRDDSSSP